jgi:hypothetical protein
MNKDEIIKLIKEYDFIINSKTSFANKYNISTKTVSNYIKEFNINCKKSGVTIVRDRDISGKFIYKSNTNKNILENNKSEVLNNYKPIRSCKDFNQRFDKYFNKN